MSYSDSKTYKTVNTGGMNDPIDKIEEETYYPEFNTVNTERFNAQSKKQPGFTGVGVEAYMTYRQNVLLAWMTHYNVKTIFESNTYENLPYGNLKSICSDKLSVKCNFMNEMNFKNCYENSIRYNHYRGFFDSYPEAAYMITSVITTPAIAAVAAAAGVAAVVGVPAVMNCMVIPVGYTNPTTNYTYVLPAGTRLQTILSTIPLLGSSVATPIAFNVNWKLHNITPRGGANNSPLLNTFDIHLLINKILDIELKSLEWDVTIERSLLLPDNSNFNDLVELGCSNMDMVKINAIHLELTNQWKKAQPFTNILDGHCTDILAGIGYLEAAIVKDYVTAKDWMGADKAVMAHYYGTGAGMSDKSNREESHKKLRIQRGENLKEFTNRIDNANEILVLLTRLKELSVVVGFDPKSIDIDSKEIIDNSGSMLDAAIQIKYGRILHSHQKRCETLMLAISKSERFKYDYTKFSHVKPETWVYKEIIDALELSDQTDEGKAILAAEVSLKRTLIQNSVEKYNKKHKNDNNSSSTLVVSSTESTAGATGVGKVGDPGAFAKGSCYNHKDSTTHNNWWCILFKGGPNFDQAKFDAWSLKNNNNDKSFNSGRGGGSGGRGRGGRSDRGGRGGRGRGRGDKPSADCAPGTKFCKYCYENQRNYYWHQKHNTSECTKKNEKSSSNDNSALLSQVKTLSEDMKKISAVLFSNEK